MNALLKAYIIPLNFLHVTLSLVLLASSSKNFCKIPIIEWHSCSQLSIFSWFTLNDSYHQEMCNLFKVGFKLSSEELNHYFCSFVAAISKMENMCIWGIKLKSLSTETRLPALKLFQFTGWIHGLRTIWA